MAAEQIEGEDESEGGNDSRILFVCLMTSDGACPQPLRGRCVCPPDYLTRFTEVWKQEQRSRSAASASTHS